MITIPTQVTLGLLQGAVGSGMRKVSGEETHHGVPLCYSSCDRAKLALRRTHNHSDMWELSRGLGLPFTDFPADGKRANSVTVGERGEDLPHPVHPSEQVARAQSGTAPSFSLPSPPLCIAIFGATVEN